MARFIDFGTFASKMQNMSVTMSSLTNEQITAYNDPNTMDIQMLNRNIVYDIADPTIFLMGMDEWGDPNKRVGE